jgi:hypothetical protein
MVVEVPGANAVEVLNDEAIDELRRAWPGCASTPAFRPADFIEQAIDNLARGARRLCPRRWCCWRACAAEDGAGGLAAFAIRDHRGARAGRPGRRSAQSAGLAVALSAVIDDAASTPSIGRRRRSIVGAGAMRGCTTLILPTARQVPVLFVEGVTGAFLSPSCAPTSSRSWRRWWSRSRSRALASLLIDLRPTGGHGRRARAHGRAAPPALGGSHARPHPGRRRRRRPGRDRADPRDERAVIVVQGSRRHWRV